jgi:hypothetical protein
MDIIRKDRCPDDTPDRNQREIKLFPEVTPHSRRVLNNLPYTVMYESSSGAVGDIRWTTRNPGDLGQVAECGA